jgi:predicted ester cyclase
MSLEDNKALFQRWFLEVVNANDYSKVEELLATHEGEFQGIAPSGQTVTITGMGIVRVEDGQIAESWWEFDALGLMTQLGAIPAPAA